jgi:hypothetical protein
LKKPTGYGLARKQDAGLAGRDRVKGPDFNLAAILEPFPPFQSMAKEIEPSTAEELVDPQLPIDILQNVQWGERVTVDDRDRSAWFRDTDHFPNRALLQAAVNVI